MSEFSARGLKLYYEDFPASKPNGEVVLLLHGLGNSGLDWEYQIEPLLQAGYRVLCPDFIGFGQSARNMPDGAELPASRLSPLSFATDTMAFLDHLAVAQCHLVGYSMGGAVAYQCAVSTPQRWCSLGIICSVPCFVPQRLTDHWQFWMRHVLSRMMGMQRLAEKVVQGLFADQPELMEKMRPRYANNSTPVYAQMLSALSHWDVRGELSRITCPVHILAAEFDYFRLEDVQESMQLLPQASLHVVTGSRHGLPLQMPELVNHDLLELFSRSNTACIASA